MCVEVTVCNISVVYLSHSVSLLLESFGLILYTDVRRNDTDKHSLTASFPLQPGLTGSRKVKPTWILVKQEMMGWQWHELDHTQIICTSLQTDNHASTSSINFFTGQMLFYAQK